MFSDTTRGKLAKENLKPSDDNKVYDQYQGKSLFQIFFNASIKNFAQAINATFAEIVRNVISEDGKKSLSTIIL